MIKFVFNCKYWVLINIYIVIYNFFLIFKLIYVIVEVIVFLFMENVSVYGLYWKISYDN